MSAPDKPTYEELQQRIRQLEHEADAYRVFRENFESLYSAMVEGVCMHELVCDSSGKAIDYRIIGVNPAYEKITAINKAQAVGRLASDLYGSGAPPYLDIFAAVAQTGKPASFETYFAPMDKHFSISVVMLEQGKFATIFFDISGVKKLEAQLQHAHKMEAIGTLAGGIAHDFNNILDIVLGNTELAIDDVPEWSLSRQNLEEIMAAGLRAKNVVQQLLKFSRDSEHRKKHVQLSPVVFESLKLLRASMPSSIEIQKDITEDDTLVFADPTHIHQVLTNLYTNAIHAMEDSGGVLDVRLKGIELNGEKAIHYHGLSPGRYLHLTVADTGCGVDPQHMDRIFDPYFTTKGPDKGAGMGLAEVHGIINNHGGVVSVHDRSGKGTTVNVLFPVTGKGGLSKETGAPEFPLGSEAVLFVDDESAIVRLGKEILQRLGYSVAATTEPQEALAWVKAEPDKFDLVIVDTIMPRISGIALAEEILSLRPSMPVVLCAGFSEKVDAYKAAQLGLKDYVEKPFDRQKLSITIRKALDGN